MLVFQWTPSRGVFTNYKLLTCILLHIEIFFGRSSSDIMKLIEISGVFFSGLFFRRDLTIDQNEDFEVKVKIARG